MNKVLQSGTSLKTIPIVVVFIIVLSSFSPAVIAAGPNQVGGESYSGAAFATPESLQDEINAYRNNSVGSLAPNAFVLASHDSLYVVFTNEEPTKGRATVSGRSAGEVTANGMTFSVLVAQSVSFKTQGSEATVSDVAQNPSEYQQELVRIRATHRRVSLLNDPDQGQDVTAAVSSGVLVENPTTANEMLSRPVGKARSLAINSSTNELGSSAKQEINELLSTDKDRIYTFDFAKHYWIDTEQTVDGIVLTPGSKARQFVSSFDKTGIVKTETNTPLLYVVETSTDPTQYDTIQSVKSNANDGDLVEVTANLYGLRVSTQETLEESAGCGQSKVQVPAPSGAVCVDVLQDALTDSGVAWSSLPESKQDVLFVAGLSSHHLDQPSEQLRGEYRIVGEVVSTKRFDDSLPDGKILLVYDFEREGGINYQELASEARNRIEERFDSLNRSVTAQLTGEPTENQQPKSTASSTSTPDSGTSTDSEQSDTQNGGSEGAESDSGTNSDDSNQQSESSVETQQQSPEEESGGATGILRSPNQDRIPVIPDVKVSGQTIPEEATAGLGVIVVLLLLLRLL